MKIPYIVKQDSKVDLERIDTDFTGGMTKEEARQKTEKNLARIVELQEALYAEHKHAVLVIFQGMDASGKDGTIKSLAGAMNPQGVHAISFKSPTQEELDHDFLWRIHKAVPAKGEVVVFNRSHYEDVLIARVDNLVPEEEWESRYDKINAFEKTLSDSGTHILKFFLHISKDEQLERFRERVENPAKHWKFNEEDLVAREKWDEYQEAYEDALSKCSTDDAPWQIIPADKKWFRDYAVSEAVVTYLEGLNIKYPAPAFDVAAVKAKYFHDDVAAILKKDKRPSKPFNAGK